MELIGRRMLDGLEAARLYGRACECTGWRSGAAVGASGGLIRSNRDAHESMGRQFSTIWLAESEPYALDWTMARYDKAVKSYDALLVN